MLETKATLRIASKVRTLEELTRALGQPTEGFSRGDPAGSRGRLREHTLWAWESAAPESAPLETHLLDVLAHVDAMPEFEQIRKDCQVDVFCMLSTTNGQGGAQVSHAVMQRMAALQINLSLDIYSDSDDE